MSHKPDDYEPVPNEEVYRQEVEEALKEADKGDFATDEEMKALDDKWNKA